MARTSAEQKYAAAKDKNTSAAVFLSSKCRLGGGLAGALDAAGFFIAGKSAVDKLFKLQP